MFVVIKNFLELVYDADCDEKGKYMGSNNLQSAKSFVRYMCTEIDASKMDKFGLKSLDKKFIEDIFMKNFMIRWILLKKNHS